MTPDEREYWIGVLEYLKGRRLHLWYSINEGWCWVSKPSGRIKITYQITWSELIKKLNYDKQ